MQITSRKIVSALLVFSGSRAVSWRVKNIDENGGSASKPPGFIALNQDCWIVSKSDPSACSRNPGPETALELLPSSALSSAQVFVAYPKIAALENRTFHLLFKPDILTARL